MVRKKIDEKLTVLLDKVSFLVNKENSDIESIHKLRTVSREILSLLNKINLHSGAIKKIIKLSNNIRDIDVLITQYLNKLPLDYQNLVDINQIKNDLNVQREEEFLVLLEYLQSFIQNQINFENCEKTIKEHSSSELSFKKKELHSYRIYVKKELYLAKNLEANNIIKINLLKQLKDYLGFINDNRNAIKILKVIISDKSNLKILKEYTKKENLELFKKAQETIRELQDLR